MPAAVIRQADADRIAAGLKARGRPIPPGLQQPPAGHPASPAKPHPAPASRPTATARAGTPGPAGRTPAAAKPSRPGRRSTTRRPGSRRTRGGGLLSIGGGGDGGGLILALWAYPLVLSLIKYGAKGPGMWLRAKFLNIDTTPTTPSTAPKTKPKTTPGSPISPAAQGEANSLGQLYGIKPKGK